jgi:hypothetical protein
MRRLPLSTSSLLAVPMFTSSYASALTVNHSVYCRYNGTNVRYYYEAIQMTVSVSQNVTIISNSSLDTFGSVYDTNFEPWNASAYLLQYDDDSGGIRQFQLQLPLISGKSYILVVTTFNTTMTGSFSVTATSPSSPVVFTLLNIVPSTTTGE